MSERFVVITGCSGGGKSTLLTELRRRGHAVVEEPGRRIVPEESAQGGSALPWLDLAAFGRRAVSLALADRAAADARGWTFFDRGLVDAARALEHATGEPLIRKLGEGHRYHRTVFFAPPWPETYVNDPERRHSFEVAQAEAQALASTYTGLGYRLMKLPKVDVGRRADVLLSYLEGESLTLSP